MKAKRMLNAALALALILGLSAAPAGAADQAENTTQAALRRWNDYKVLQGDGQGNLLPDATLTRGAFAAMLDRVMGYRATVGNSFADLPETAWYTPYVLRLNAVGVLNGNGVLAMPEAQVTRQEAVALLGRALGLEESSAALSFTDKAEVPDWCAGYLSAMAARGCFAGEAAFRPAEAMTRAEAIVMLDTLVTAFVSTDGNYSADASGSVVVNSANVTLKSMKVGGDLIIADGVGNGDVYLDNVTVAGRVILRGCGVNSFHLLPGTVVTGTIIVTKSSDGGVRLVNESGKVLPIVNVADGSDGVTLTGEFKNVVIASDAPVALVNATVKETVSVTAPGSSVTLSGTSSVKQLDVAKTAEKAAVTMTDSAKVTTVNVAGNGLTLDNTSKNKPTIMVDSSVTTKPTDSGGNSVNTAPPSGGGGGGGGSTTSPTPPAVTTLTSVTALLPSPLADKPAVDAAPAGAGYTVQTVWSPTLTNNTFAKGTTYTATLTFSLATDAYQWGASAPKVEVRNSTEYAGDAKVGVAVLDTQAKTVTVTATYPETASEIKIIPSTISQNKELTEGYTSEWISATGYVTVNDVKAENYTVSYQWYQFTDINMSGKARVENAAQSTYTLPESLAAGTYYYACAMNADGADELMSNVITVTVTPAPAEEKVVLSNAQLSIPVGPESHFGLQLTWTSSHLAHDKYLVEFSTTNGRQDDISGVYKVNVAPNSENTASKCTLYTQYLFRNLDACIITQITLTPVGSNDTPIGESLTLPEGSITITVTELENKAVTFNRTTKGLQFSGENLYLGTNPVYFFELRAEGQAFVDTFTPPPFSTILKGDYITAAESEGAVAVFFALNSSGLNSSFTVNVQRTLPQVIRIVDT